MMLSRVGNAGRCLNLGDRHVASARTEEFRLPEKASAREAFIEQVGEDGYAPMGAVGSADSPEWLRQIEAVEVLRWVWIEPYQLIEGPARCQGPGDQQASSRLITSPYDATARFATQAWEQLVRLQSAPERDV